MTAPSQSFLALGLMSGTSADGVDAALVRTDGEAAIDFIAASTCPYEPSLRESLLQAAQQDIPLSDLLRLERSLTWHHIEASRQLITQQGISSDSIEIIGFHGHTIRHLAAESLTWQLGNPSLLAFHLNATVVSDFRRLDIAAGGQGAPLAPLFHQQICQDHPKPVAVLNLGGVGNLTWLGDGDAVYAGDTGPGCGLLDAWVQQHFGLPMDGDGKLALQGKIDHEAVNATLRQPFFQRPFPRSADRYEFDITPVQHLAPHDGLATLCSITASAVADAIKHLPCRPLATYVTGGGSKHPLIMALLSESLGKVEPIESLQWRSESLEAECFAWLAVRGWRGLPTAIPSTTGSSLATSGCNITRPR